MTKNRLYSETYMVGPHSEWIVFLHGAGGSTATWKYQVEQFKGNYNLLLIDLRDHGQSKQIEPSHTNYTFDVITEDVMDVLQMHYIKKAHFITLSFGSVLLQDLSIKYPSLVASAIFAGGIFKANVWIKSFVQMARFLNVVLPYSWMYNIFSYLLMPKKRHQRSRKIYKIQAQKLTAQEYMKWVGLYGEFFALLNRFFYQKISFPGLVIMGKEDYIFLNAAQSFVCNQNHVNIVVIDHAGHICNIDSPEEFNQIGYNFIRKHSYLSADFPTINAQ
ncbi:alpha/beta hydrolase [Marivirga lumbricoides]|uniref:Alpha/beta hydrolase n=1 Tax=Marivirga lumbricoides TaxID=1046115 RepID=A0ABQ1LWU6_9BACT|nr:alpha/beta hydrolase [Marivirga lumbricoides]